MARNRAPSPATTGRRAAAVRRPTDELTELTELTDERNLLMLPPRVDTDLVAERIGPYADGQPPAAERGAVYEELLGFVPPRIEARLAVTGALDPTLLDLQERIRAHAMYPEAFDTKTAQLMLFGMLLMDLNDAAQLHAIAARRAGASWKELQATISLCFLFRGLSAANRGAEILANIAKREAETGVGPGVGTGAGTAGRA